nr:AAA family ATPase [Fusobacterium gastrosuis]
MIKEIYIKKFRGIENKKIELGRNITVFAGKNGTQKSTLLGLLGHPFVFFGNKHKGETKSNFEYRTLFNSYFEANFSELFKFSPKYDNPENHPYEIKFMNGTFKLDKCFLNSKKRNENTIRILHYKNDNYTEYGVFSDFIYPVLYLGLSRLFPIGESAKLEKQTLKIEDREIKEEFKKNYNKILKQVDSFQAEILKKDKGESIGIDTGYYDSYGNSAGQDNIGRILGSILSFKKLKKEYPEYKGGILLIDELDVSLYTASQIMLFNVLDEYSRELNLQIIFTTHSLDLLKYIKNKNKKDIELYYFIKQGKNIVIDKNPSFKNISNNICFALENKNEVKEKIKIYTEDELASSALKNILKNTIKLSLIEVVPLIWDWKTIKNANKKFNLDKHLFIYDGDVPYTEIKKDNEMKLPFTKAIEVEMLNYLNTLPPENNSWDLYSFNKEHFEDKIFNLSTVNLTNTNSCKNVLEDKKFFKCVEKVFWENWPKENKNHIDDFLRVFETKYKNIINMDSYTFDEIKK